MKDQANLLNPSPPRRAAGDDVGGSLAVDYLQADTSSKKEDILSLWPSSIHAEADGHQTLVYLSEQRIDLRCRRCAIGAASPSTRDQLFCNRDVHYMDRPEW